MFSKPLAFILLALGCVTAAAGGAYVATRQNTTVPAAAVAEAPAPAPPAASSVTPAPAPQPVAGLQPVAETEAAVTSPKAAAPAAAANAEAPVRNPAASKARETVAPKRPTDTARNTRTAAPPVRRTVPMNGRAPAAETLPQSAPAAPAPVAAVPEPPRQAEPQAELPRAPRFEEVILPAASVIGLQLESTLSSERARIEDRVDARVTRDVLAAGRVAIPAGSRVLGSVTLVERGGKVKERARLGVRFHTLILADGSEVPLHTEAIYRDGDSPAGDSSKKIGVAAVGGAILGGILGGKKGAAIGGATGAAGGTAAVMAGDRQAASLRGGEIVTARLSEPTTITVERRE
jgi:hypothetical protein